MHSNTQESQQMFEKGTVSSHGTALGFVKGSKLLTCKSL